MSTDKILIVLSISILLCGYNGQAGGKFEVYNYTPFLGVYPDYVEFIEFSSSNGHHPYGPGTGSDRLSIFYDSGAATWTSVGVSPSQAHVYKCPMRYDGSPVVLNGISNAVGFSHYSPYASNVLLTYLVKQRDTVAAGDARQVIHESEYADYNWGWFNIGTISNAVDGEIYATNWVNIAPIETTITNCSILLDDTNVTIHAQLRPGTVAWPEYIHDLTISNDWTSLTNEAQYLEVTTNNFGGFDTLSWSNLVATNAPVFFRLRCDSYNDDTAPLVSEE